MMDEQRVHSDLPIPPGEYLTEVISELGMTRMSWARRMNRPATKLSAIFSGDKAITADTALQLEKGRGRPGSYLDRTRVRVQADDCPKSAMELLKLARD